jgi:hypothetical protein
MITDFAAWRNRQYQKQVKPKLILDADEVLSGPLPQNLPRHYNYAFRRDDWFLGRWLKHGETAAVWLTRYLQPKSGRWVGKVHERFESDLQVEYLKEPRIQHRRQITLSQFIDKLNYYSDLRAEEISRFSIFELLFYPWVKFVKNYWWHLGFLDGIPGLIMAFSMSLHSLFVRVKIYEKTR